MPIQIRELIIRAVVEPEPAPRPGIAVEEDRAALIQTCVNEVLAILRRERER